MLRSKSTLLVSEWKLPCFCNGRIRRKFSQSTKSWCEELHFMIGINTFQGICTLPSTTPRNPKVSRRGRLYLEPLYIHAKTGSHLVVALHPWHKCFRASFRSFPFALLQSFALFLYPGVLRRPQSSFEKLLRSKGFRVFSDCESLALFSSMTWVERASNFKWLAGWIYGLSQCSNCIPLRWRV
jgi:hypothetical protein